MLMTAAVRERFEYELETSRGAVREGDMESAWQRLEEAHVLSQPWALPHVRTHAQMLLLGLRTRDAREVMGQVVRLLVAAPGSVSGRYPAGNSGRARVSMFSPMPVPSELADLLELS